MFMPPDWQFGPECAKKIIEYFQTTYERFREFTCAKSFVYRAIDRFKSSDIMSAKDPFRDLMCLGEPPVNFMKASTGRAKLSVSLTLIFARSNANG